MKLRLCNINPPPLSFLRVYTKYDAYPDVIKLPIFPMFKPIIRRRNTDCTAFYPLGEEYSFLDYEIANIRIGLEGVKFIRYKNWGYNRRIKNDKAGHQNNKG